MKSFEKIMLLLSVLWMVVIFAFSAEPDTQSQKMSSGVSYQIVRVIDYVTGSEWSEAQKEQYAQKIDYPVRKMAHMSEYAILTLLLFGSMAYRNERKKYVMPLVITFLYACTDEFHQIFVQGRAGRFSDVLIDTAGGALMTLLMVGVAVLSHKKYNNKKFKKRKR